MPIVNNAGPVVRGEDFFPRLREVERLWKPILSGHHVLLVAPRRVGKTSLVEYLREHPRGSCHLVYIPVESIDSTDEFFRRLHRSLFDDTASHFAQVLDTTKAFLGRFRKLEIAGAAGFEIDGAHQNWYEQFTNYLAKIVKDKDFDEAKVILVLDEFPQVVENIRQKHGNEAAVLFLQMNRDIRHVAVLHGKVQFVYTGSIGLEHIVAQMEATRTINDLRTVTVEPMTEEEAISLVKEIVLHPTYKVPNTLFTDDIIQHILRKVQWYIPFYIQLLLQVIEDKRQDDATLEISAVDDAFEEMLTKRNYFDHWIERLRKAFLKEDYHYAEDILNLLAQEGIRLQKNELYDIAVKYNIQKHYRQILSALIHDGYIVEEQDFYRFNSPVVQAWWRKNVAH